MAKSGLTGFLLLVLSGASVANDSAYTTTDAIHSREHGLQVSPRQGVKQFAKTWGISEREALEYQQAMRGRRGQWSPGLDPLLVLGVEAKDAATRKRFAERFVKAEFERTEQELAFQREVDAAWGRLYPNSLRIGRPLSSKPVVAEPKTERLALFVKRTCPTCARMTRDALARAHRLGVVLDIYLTDSKGRDQTLSDWAASEGIQPAWVSTGAVTLNHIGDTDPSQAPAVYVKRQGMSWEREL